MLLLINALLLHWLQARFLGGKKRLESRRLDWLVYIILGPMADHYKISRHQKSQGVVLNRAARRHVNDAIVKARTVPDTAVSMQPQPGHAQVQSSSTEGLHYSVSGLGDNIHELSCTCPMGQMRQLCKHVVKVLLHQGVSEDLMLRFLGLFAGATEGGLKGLKAAHAAALAQMQPEQASTPLPQDMRVSSGQPQDQPQYQCVDQPAQAQSEGSAMEPAAVDEGLQPSKGARCSDKEAAHAAIEKLAAAGSSWADDSPNWKLLRLCALTALHDVQKGAFDNNVASHELARGPLLPNADALPGTSLKRQQSQVERALQRRSDQERRQQAETCENQKVLGFLVQAQPRKPVSVMQQVEAKLARVPQNAAAARAAPCTAAMSALHMPSSIAGVPALVALAGSSATALRSAAAVAGGVAPIPDAAVVAASAVAVGIHSAATPGEAATTSAVDRSFPGSAAVKRASLRKRHAEAAAATPLKQGSSTRRRQEDAIVQQKSSSGRAIKKPLHLQS